MSVLGDLLVKKQLCPIPIPSARCVVGLCSSTALACRQDLCGTWWWQWWKGRGTAVTAPVGVQPWEHRRMGSAGLALLSCYLNNGGKNQPLPNRQVQTIPTSKTRWIFSSISPRESPASTPVLSEIASPHVLADSNVPVKICAANII